MANSRHPPNGSDWHARFRLHLHPNRLRGHANEIIRRSGLRGLYFGPFLPSGFDNVANRAGQLSPDERPGKRPDI